MSKRNYDYVAYPFTGTINCPLSSDSYGLSIEFCEAGKIRIQTRGDSRYWKEFKDAGALLDALQRAEKFGALTSLLRGSVTLDEGT